METPDSLKRENPVTVTILGPDDTCLYQSTHTGYHSIEDAISQSIADAHLKIDPKLCVFEISNRQTGVAHRYRLNAHGNLKLIV